MIRRSAAILLLALTAALPARRGDAQCPTSTIVLYRVSETFSTTAATADQNQTGRHAAFDLTAGWLEITHPGDLGGVTCDPTDRYRVVGLPDGTPVHLIAQLVADGSSYSSYSSGSGEFGAWIRSGNLFAADSVEAASFVGLVPLKKTLELPLDVLAGQDFDLQFRLWFYRSPGGAQYGGGRAVIRFSGLAPGVDVVSCQGYQLTVPTRPTSWGKLKQLYR